MKFLLTSRRFVVGLLAALATLTAGFSFVVAAQSKPTVAVMAPDKAVCKLTNQQANATTRGQRFAIDERGFAANEPVAISFTFPDGRVYSPAVTQPGSNPAVPGTTALDGIKDEITDPGFFGQANPGGDYTSFFLTTNAWPHECYKITVQGTVSKIQVSDYLVVKDAPLPMKGAISLDVHSHTGLTNSGEQSSAVDIFGRGFKSGEVVKLQMIQPNGTIINLPAPLVSTIGSFQTSVTLGIDHQVGEYTFVATSGNSQTKQGTFTLKPQAAEKRDFTAQLNISDPVPATTVQSSTLQLQGKLFQQGELVEIRLIQANGVIRTLDQIQANDLGEFTDDLTLSVQLPTGVHQLVAISPTARATIQFQLNAGRGVVPAAAADDAIISPNSFGLVAPSGAGTSPSATAGTEADPSATAGTEADPSATAGTKADPSATAGTEADPSATAGTNADPSATAGTEADPSATAGAEPSATTGAEPSPSSDADVPPDYSTLFTPDTLPVTGIDNPAPTDVVAAPLVPIDPPAPSAPPTPVF